MARNMAVLLALVLVGCAAQSEQSQEAEAAAQDAARCQAHGYKPGSADYDQCLTDLENQRTHNERAALMGRLQGRSPMLN
jgi:hypothetical protein